MEAGNGAGKDTGGRGGKRKESEGGGGRICGEKCGRETLKMRKKGMVGGRKEKHRGKNCGGNSNIFDDLPRPYNSKRKVLKNSSDGDSLVLAVPNLTRSSPVGLCHSSGATLPQAAQIGQSSVDNLNYRSNDNFLVTVAKKASCGIGIVRPPKFRVHKRERTERCKCERREGVEIFKHAGMQNTSPEMAAVNQDPAPDIASSRAEGDSSILGVHVGTYNNASCTFNSPVRLYKHDIFFWEEVEKNHTPTREGSGGVVIGLLASYLGIFASGNRVGRCRCSAGFLWALPFTLRLHSGVAPYSARFTLIGSKDLDVMSRRNVNYRVRWVIHYLPKSNWSPVHNVCSVVVTPLESRRATSCGYNSSHPVWHALYECLQDIHGDSSPFLLQPFHELSNGFWPRLTSPHPAIQFVPKMFYRAEVGALGGPVQLANIVVGVPLQSSP
ncbi:hypothetical protein PR048_025419 [Dryococelus australis]|uniref:Uncharacterized protein n=1 Tax=Dryococelus australis TaxID=614101 RepID=A0ABQ9GRA3_9NEOP|nr:hypothetical protein PR048_025419 [Dryococelus australis]